MNTYANFDLNQYSIGTECCFIGTEGLNGQNHSLSDSNLPVKKNPSNKISSSI